MGIDDDIFEIRTKINCIRNEITAVSCSVREIRLMLDAKYPKDRQDKEKRIKDSICKGVDCKEPHFS